jgi:DNA topoisomerase-2
MFISFIDMHLYNNKGIICKYDNIEEIMKEFYLIRLVYYTKRKEYMLKTLQKELVCETKIGDKALSRSQRGDLWDRP